VRERAARQQLLVRLHRLLHLRLLRALQPAESQMVLSKNEAKTGESKACLLELLLRRHNFHRAHFLDELEPSQPVTKQNRQPVTKRIMRGMPWPRHATHTSSLCQ
jgi:hypothetical protein